MAAARVKALKLIVGSHALVFAVALCWVSACHAQMIGKVDLEAAEIAAQLMGAPVFAADGREIGEVADVAIDEEGQVGRIRISTSATLGLGTRIVELSKGSFIALRGAVVLDVPTDALKALPEQSASDPER